MYFYVDESGHTGGNLFDAQQPMLSYGVLSSPVNVDVLAEDRLQALRKRANAPRLHATELGNGGLVPLVNDLKILQKQLDLRFDMYRVAKPDHSIICFFDQVFDQGLNPAVTWTGYWTPLRYVLLLKLASLFDEDLARIAWEARLEGNDQKSHTLVTKVCQELIQRVIKLPDARSRLLISDTLTWASANPERLSFNTKSKADRLSVMPNMIGFQSVMHGIAKRLNRTGMRASRIIVDQQSQFNTAQKTLADLYASMNSVQFANGPGLPEISYKGIPNIPIEIASSRSSAGLELVDLYLWIFKRILEKQDLAPELILFVQPQFRRGRMDEVSLKAIANRWQKWFDNLPEPTNEEMAKGQQILAKDEARRRAAIRQNNE